MHPLVSSVTSVSESKVGALGWLEDAQGWCVKMLGSRLGRLRHPVILSTVSSRVQTVLLLTLLVLATRSQEHRLKALAREGARWLIEGLADRGGG